VIVHDARVANLYHQEFRAIVNAVTGNVDGLSNVGEPTWSLMPNPAREQVWLQGVQATDVVRVLDAGGRAVDVVRVRQGSAVQLELGRLKAGMYHVTVTSSNGVKTSRRLAVQ
jgi:hypothetical protein